MRTPGESRRRGPWLRVVLPSLLVAIAAAASLLSSRAVSVATSDHFDEPLHCRAGCIYLEGAGLRETDGPFDRLAGLSSIANAAWMRSRGFESVRGPELVSREGLVAAREVNHALGAALVLLLACIAAAWWGAWAGAVAAIAAAASPTLLSHAAIVSPDVHTAFLALIAAMLLYRWLRLPRAITAIAFGVVVALAAAVKLLTLALPLLGLALLVTRRRWMPEGRPFPRGRWIRGLAIGALATLATAWGIHAWTGLGDPSAWCGAAFDWWGEMFSAAENKRKLRTFFAGDVRRTHRLFVPATIALKVPLALLLATAAAVSLRLVGAGRRTATTPAFRFAGLIAVGYVLVVWLSRSQLGIRHLLPALLFLPLAAASLVALDVARHRWFRTAVVAGGAWLVIGTARVMPFPLAFGNELAGGPNGIHRWFVDSQLDWGQGFLALKRWRDEHPDATPLKLAFFGSCPPTRYGLDCEILPSPLTPGFTRPETDRLPDDVRGWIAISETTLKGTYANQMGQATDYYRILEDLPIVARVGYAIRIIKR